MKKSISKVLAFSLAAAMVVTGVCSTENADAASKKKVKKVTAQMSVAGTKVAVKKVLVKTKGKVTLKVAVTPAKANKKVTYKIANKKIATVNKKGVIKGKKAGTTTVKVISKANKKKFAKVKVVVAKKVPTKVTMKKTMKLYTNTKKTAKLNAKLKAKGVKKANKTIFYVSSKKKVAKVSKKGVVTAVSTGSAVIRAYTLNGKAAKCKVTVGTSTTAVTTAAAATTTAVTCGTVTTLGDKKVAAKAYKLADLEKIATVIFQSPAGNEVKVPATLIAKAEAKKITAAGAAKKYDAVKDVKDLTVKTALEAVAPSVKPADLGFTGAEKVEVKADKDTYTVTAKGDTLVATVTDGQIVVKDAKGNDVALLKDGVLTVADAYKVLAPTK